MKIITSDVGSSSLREPAGFLNKHILKDGYGRHFSYLRLSITDVCNFKCNYCLPNGYTSCGKKSFLSLDEIQTLLQACAKTGISKVRITGGEPSTRKDLEDIIKICAETPGIETVALTSNGYKLASRLPQLYANGLTALNISIDSLNSKSFADITGRNVLSDVMKTINTAISLDIKKIKVNAVLLKRDNMQELDEFLSFIKHRNITIRFIELMQTGDNTTFFSQQHIPAENIKQNLLDTGWKSIKRGVTAGPAQEFSHPDYQGNIGLIMPYGKDFCASCNRFRISSTGKLQLCLFASENHDLRFLLQEDIPKPQQIERMIVHLQRLFYHKDEKHSLDQGFSGNTEHFAMIGG
jgi:GTP 3',8-cyclase